MSAATLEHADATADDHADDVVSADRVVWIITAVAVVVFWLIMTSWRPWDLLDRAGFSADFYDEQARAFLRGRLSVDPSIPGPEGFVIDGRTYLYYGPFLSIVRMPFMLFGDLFVGRLVRVSMLIALAVACRWSARLACAGREVVRSAGRDVLGDERWPVGIVTAAVAFSPALFAAGWISVYHETELWALAFAIIAVTLLVEWAATGFTDRRALAGTALATLAATLTRAPIGIGVCIALVGCGAVLAWRSRSRGWGPAIGAGWMPVAAGVLPVAVHAAVNWAKFDSLFGVPGGRQLLSLQDPERAAWFAGNNESFFSTRFLPTTLVQYWRPDAIRFERLVPGVRFGPLATDRGSYPVESITPATSITLSATLLLVLAVVGALWMLRHRCRTWLLVLAGTIVGTLPTFTIGFIANRYLIDMLPPLVVGAAVGTWVVHALPYRRVVRVAGVALALWGLWVNAALATWTLEYKTAGFTEVRYGIDRALFGDGGSPSLITLVPGAAVPRDGVVALDPDCAGVYISEQGRWVALERADGLRSTTGTIEDLDAGTAVIAEGRGWMLELAGEGVPETLRIVGDDGAVLSEQPAAPEATGPFPLDYEVVVDPVTGEFVAQIGDLGLLLPPDVVATGGTIG
ncbi:MAG: hypothetical protein ACM3MM_00035, partial [Acidobacteriota bacterium]